MYCLELISSKEAFSLRSKHPKAWENAKQLKKQIEEDTKEKGDTLDIHSELLTFQSENGLMKGNFRLEGWNITAAEFLIQSPKWNKNVPFKTTVNSLSPLRLPQIHNTFNHLKVALSLMQTLETRTAAASEGVLGCYLLSKILEEVAESIKLATEEILLPSRDLFPRTLVASIHSLQQPVFYPLLPEDLFLEVSITNVELIVSSFCLSRLEPSSKNIPHKPTHPHSQHSSPVIGQLFKGQRKNVLELVDTCTVRCSANLLTHVFQQMREAYQLCAELRNKLALFP